MSSKKAIIKKYDRRGNTTFHIKFSKKSGSYKDIDWWDFVPTIIKTTYINNLLDRKSVV